MPSCYRRSSGAQAYRKLQSQMGKRIREAPEGREKLRLAQKKFEERGEEDEPEPIKPEPKKKTVQLLAPIASEKEVSL